jgi:hypothetical protein
LPLISAFPPLPLLRSGAKPKTLPALSLSPPPSQSPSLCKATTTTAAAAAAATTTAAAAATCGRHRSTLLSLRENHAANNNIDTRGRRPIEAMVARAVLRTGRRRASIVKIAGFWNIGVADAAELVLAVESRQTLPSIAVGTVTGSHLRNSAWLHQPRAHAVN